LPAMVTDAVAGGLAGGPFGGAFGGAGWADRAATATNRLAQTKRRFIVVFLREDKSLPGAFTPDATIVAPEGRLGETGTEDRLPVFGRQYGTRPIWR